jgi:ribonuclease T1
MKTPYFKTWILVFATLLMFAMQAFARDRSGLDVVPVRELPVEAQKTLVLIKQGGPFSYPKDGVVFGNYEKLLPKQRRGYYHEYTVKTPGARNRGARRIVAGGDPATSGEYYYTEDHYATFRRIIE